MKKIFYSLILFISLFIFNNNVEAIFEVEIPDSKTCYYRNEKEDVTLVTYSGNGITVKVLDDFTIDDVTIDAGYTQTRGTNQWKLANPGFWSWMGGVDSIEAGKCYQYILYNGEDTWTGDEIDFYFTDTKADIAEQEHDLVFELLNNYQDSNRNSILEELYCSYSPGAGSAGDWTVGHISFKVTTDGKGGGQYSILNNHEVLYTNKFDNYDNIISSTASSRKIIDHFSLRSFWVPELGIYACPPSIMIGYYKYVESNLTNSIVQQELEFGYNLDHMKKYTDSYTSEGWFNKVQEHSHRYDYVLQQNASYIKYETSNEGQGEICNYTRNGNNEWYISLNEVKHGDINYYQSLINEKYGELKDIDTSSIPSDIIFSSCDNLPYIYTDCFTNSRSKCKVSVEPFKTRDENGRELNVEVEQLVTNDFLNSQSYLDTLKGMSEYNGFKYKELICNLKYRLNDLTTQSALNSTSNIKLYDTSSNLLFDDKITKVNCDVVGINYQCKTEECKNNLLYETENYLQKTKEYCNTVYSKHIKDKNNKNLIGRSNECVSFEMFYDDLVKLGIVTNQTKGCAFISTDLSDKLVSVLDWIKIIGPLAAVFLGMLDFLKAIASGDPDKENKNAFKRLTTRLIAAALLFLIPLILAFVMDLFLTGEKGYDPDNPFCDLVDWSE